MLLTIGAIILLGTIILTTDGEINSTDQTLNTTNFGLEEVALATKIIEEAEATAFDENVALGNPINTANDFTPPRSLGTEGAEGNNANYFNDFDDWNGVPGGAGLILTYDNLATGNYRALTQVKYVKYNTVTHTLDTTSSSSQYAKRLDVWVWNTVDSSKTGVIHMFTVKGYW